MAISRTPVENGIDFYSQSFIHTPITKTTSNITGDEILTEGTPVTITGAIYKRENADNPDKPGLFNGSDAILLVKINVSISKNDKITYDNEDYRVQVEPVLRKLAGTTMYYKIDLFKI